MSYLAKYSSRDLLYIAVMSALGLAIKPVVTPLVHLVSAPLMIPGGSLAGGLYLLWMVLLICLVRKSGAALLMGIAQALVMVGLGYFGSHGAVSLISYTLPALILELVWLIFHNPDSPVTHVLLCASANITGALVVTLLVMRLPFLPTMLSLTAAAISGIMGGILSYKIYLELKKYRLV
jgi:ABC-type thiamin/hydroxymethylpyrimidine transport system permease subunit